MHGYFMKGFYVNFMSASTVCKFSYFVIKNIVATGIQYMYMYTWNRMETAMLLSQSTLWWFEHYYVCTKRHDLATYILLKNLLYNLIIPGALE